ncbi:hypothetical protein B0H13DRAFT_1875962 [Mycena leptocephala]|nr:hypothetical protein B0H13DRAFT_1875962 [Mycena leptocephala]
MGGPGGNMSALPAPSVADILDGCDVPQNLSKTVIDPLSGISQLYSRHPDGQIAFVDEDTHEARRAKKLESAAAYRESTSCSLNLSEIEKRYAGRIQQSYIEENELSAYENREPRRYMIKTQSAYEGRPPPRRPTASVVSNKAKRRKLEAPEAPTNSGAKSDDEGHASSSDSDPVGSLCDCVGTERCDKCRICRCRAWWCQGKHPPGMERPPVLCLAPGSESAVQLAFPQQGGAEGTLERTAGGDTGSTPGHGYQILFLRESLEQALSDMEAVEPAAASGNGYADWVVPDDDDKSDYGSENDEETYSGYMAEEEIKEVTVDVLGY